MATAPVFCPEMMVYQQAHIRETRVRGLSGRQCFPRIECDCGDWVALCSSHIEDLIGIG
jgi:hypothetical protein